MHASRLTGATNVVQYLVLSVRVRPSVPFQNLAAPSTSRRVEQYLDDDPGSLPRLKGENSRDVYGGIGEGDPRGGGEKESDLGFDFFRHAFFFYCLTHVGKERAVGPKTVVGFVSESNRRPFFFLLLVHKPYRYSSRGTIVATRGKPDDPGRASPRSLAFFLGFVTSARTGFLGRLSIDLTCPPRAPDEPTE